jgi:hypothetical protein
MLADSLATAALYGSLGGDFDHARATSREAGEISNAIGNVWGQAYSLSGYCYTLLARAEYTELISASYDCLRLAKEAGYLAPPIMNRAVLAEALADLGQMDAALREAQAALEYAKQHVFRLREVALGAVALQQVNTGAATEALQTASQAEVERFGEAVWASEPIRKARVEAALALRSPEALHLAEQWLAPMRNQNMLPSIAAALEGQARAQRQVGQFEAARASLTEARTICEQLGARRTLWRVLRGLAAIAPTPDEKTTLLAASREVVSEIASELTDPAWREGFLKRVEEWSLEPQG